MTKQTLSKRLQLEYDLLTYISGGYYDFCSNDELYEVFNDFDSEWQKLPCDDDGANPEQQKALDDLIKKYVDILINKGY